MLSIHDKRFSDPFAAENYDEGGQSVPAGQWERLKAQVSAKFSALEYEIRREKKPVAILRLEGITTMACIIIGGKSYTPSRSHKQFDLRLDSEDVASATKHIFRRVFDVVWQHKHFTLKQTSFFSTTFAVLEGDQAIGSINCLGVNNPNFDDTIDLPDEIGLEVQIFMAWLVISTRGGGGGEA